MKLTMNLFHLDNSIILMQRSFILTIFVCTALFSSCALEQPDSSEGASPASLYSTILQELETNLSSTNSGRSHQISSSAKTADTGKTPPESAFPKTNISGLASS